MKRIILILSCLMLAGTAFAQVLSIAFPRDSQIEYDPHQAYTSTEAQLLISIYEGLVSYHPSTMEPVPGVASSWKQSSDRKTYTFTLREDARYFNGDQVTAAHFIETYKRFLSPSTRAPYASLFDIVEGAKDFRAGRERDFSKVGIKAPDRWTLEFTLNTPAPYFLKILAHHSFVVLHPDAKFSNDGLILGNGAYFIREQTEDGFILEKNELYWNAAEVEIEEISILFSEDVTDLTGKFINGEIDWLANGVDFELFQSNPYLIITPQFSTSFFTFRTDSQAGSDINVRKALTLLLPLEEIRDPEFYLQPASRIIPEVPGYPEAEGFTEQNLEEAYALLEAAGYPRGKGLEPITILTFGEPSRIEEIIFTTWSESLETEVRYLQQTRNYYQQMSEGGYTLASLSWIGDFPDPISFLELWKGGSDLNDSKYDNPVFNELLAQSNEEEGDERFKLLQQAEQLLLNDAVVLPINNSPSVNLVNVDVFRGWYSNPLDLHPFQYFVWYQPEDAPGIVMAK
jgi:oligopeptide transport system substrate-binding protein